MTLERLCRPQIVWNPFNHFCSSFSQQFTLIIDFYHGSECLEVNQFSTDWTFVADPTDPTPVPDISKDQIRSYDVKING